MDEITKAKVKRIFYVLAVLSIAFIASLPAFRSGVIAGHDLKFHLGRIQAIAEELQKGQFPVRFESSAWYGHGYISTTMYGNIFLYIPALLYMAGLPVYRAYNIYVIAINLLTAVLSYYSFTKLFNGRRYGIIATLLYVLSGYHLTNLYVRAAVGEYTAMAFLPLVVLGIYQIYSPASLNSEKEQNKKKRPTSLLNLPLIFGVTGIIESHILTTEIVAVLILLYALVNLKTTLNSLAKLFANLGMVVAMNLFFLVPFVETYLTTKMNINAGEPADISSSGLYLRQILGLLTEGYGHNVENGFTEEGAFNFGILMLVCAIATVVIIIRKRTTKDITTVFCFGLVAAWLSSCYFPWKLFAGEGALSRLMSSVQYPWRYLMVMTLCATITGTYAAKLFVQSPKRRLKNIIQFNGEIRPTRFFIGLFAGAFALALVTTAYFDYTLVCKNKTECYADAPENWADTLYLPVDTDTDALKETEGTASASTYINYNHLKPAQSENAKAQLVEPAYWRLSELISLAALLAVILLHTKKKAKN